MLRIKILAAVAIGFALSASAAELQLHLVPHSPVAASCTAAGSLIARSVEGEAVRVPLRAGQTSYRITVGDEQIWHFAAEAEGCWSNTVLWAATEQGEVSLDLYREASIEGAFEAAGEPARDIEGIIFPLKSDGSSAITGESGMPLRCQLELPRWRCTVPAGLPFDLRLDVKGFGAIHYWSVIANEGPPRKLEPQRLYRGASVAGWIQDQSGIPVAGARMTLYPLEAESSRTDRLRLVARRRTAVANARGFFQFAGLEGGVYRLVSEAKGLSPVRVPEVRVREGESLTWPRSIVQAPIATLDVWFNPTTHPDGTPWLVELSEKTPLHLEPKPPASGRGTPEGRWTAGELRADVYELTVRDQHGSVLERMDVDLGDGGGKSIIANVRTIVVNGAVRLGGEPLSADITFSNFTGKTVQASASDDGQFRAVFPTGGKWSPEVRYPRESGGTVTLDPVSIDPAGASDIELVVPGGRIRGHVVGPENAAGRSAVHVLRRGKLVAQVVTPDSGKFDFIGIEAGEYSIEAEGVNSATSKPVEFRVEDDEVKEIRIVLAPLRRISGTVLTPSGMPASGAVIQVLADQGRSWNRIITDVAGRFDYPTAAGSGDIGLVVLTYAFPSAMVRISAEVRSAVTIQLRPDGGILRVRNGAIPYVRTTGLSAPMRAFLFPEPFGRFNGGAHLEAGTYIVCPNRGLDSSCRTVSIAPDSDVEVDFSPPKKQEDAVP